jgi:2-polyprenyl-3-methyl-5-hydroxy-6-metoxy-1,4-benzoquinol methylase
VETGVASRIKSLPPGGRLGEAEWWESFSDIATRQWELTPQLNRIVRDEYLQEMWAHLLRPGGRLLEIGCGSGWAGMKVAKLGMSLTGVDTSPAQVTKARQAAQLAGLEQAEFLVGTLSQLDRRQKYDGILVHAVLHHLSEDDTRELLTHVRDFLNPGGRLYIYEPLRSPRRNAFLSCVASLAFILVWSPWWLLQKIGVALKIGPPQFRDAVRRGWTGLSPREWPLERDWLLERLSQGYVVEPPRYWHAYSLALAMGCSELSPAWSQAAGLLVRMLYWVDQRLLCSPLRDYILGVWTFASIRATALL